MEAETSLTGGNQIGNSQVGESSSKLPSIIPLKEPPITLKPSETEQDATEVAVVKLLIKSYYDIVRKNSEDAIPKAVMHFLVNHTKRDLHNFLIRKLYRENLLNELMRETDEVLMRRQRIQEMLEILEQAHRTLEEFPFEVDKLEKGYNLTEHATGLSKIHGVSGDSTNVIYTSSPNCYSPHRASHMVL